MVAEFGGTDIRCSKYATFGTKKLAELVLDAIKERKGCLIANHGQICLGGDIDEALHLSNSLEKLSKQYYFCMASKQIKLLSRDQMKDVVNSFASYKT
jgi:L-fuculose-phosphate aldolase